MQYHFTKYIVGIDLCITVTEVSGVYFWTAWSLRVMEEVIVLLILSFMSLSTQQQRQRRVAGNVVDLYSENAWSGSRKGDRIFWLRFLVVFLTPFMQTSVLYFNHSMTSSFEICPNPLSAGYPIIKCCKLLLTYLWS